MGTQCSSVVIFFFHPPPQFCFVTPTPSYPSFKSFFRLHSLQFKARSQFRRARRLEKSIDPSPRCTVFPASSASDRSRKLEPIRPEEFYLFVRLFSTVLPTNASYPRIPLVFCTLGEGYKEKYRSSGKYYHSPW